jgi:hypothetical protein
MLKALSEKRISEGHTRPLLMLADKPEEQEVLFKEILIKKITVREAERIARNVAVERARKKETLEKDSEMTEIEGKLNEALGTRVMIERREVGGKIVIDFFNNDDLHHLLQILEGQEKMKGFSEKIKSELARAEGALNAGGDSVGVVAGGYGSEHGEAEAKNAWTVESLVTAPNSEFMQNQKAREAADNVIGDNGADGVNVAKNQVEQNEQMIQDLIKSDDDLGVSESGTPIDDSSPADRNEDDEDLYSIKNFSL